MYDNCCLKQDNPPKQPNQTKCSNDWLRRRSVFQLPGGGVDMTLSELQEMAARQQQQIESQQHILVAKEQRLKYLKQQVRVWHFVYIL